VLNKYCTKCKVEKEVSGFCKNPSTNDGLNGWCKTCVNEKNKKYYRVNREVALKYREKYYNANRDEILKKVKEYQKGYFQTEAGKAVRIRATRKWKKQNPEKEKACTTANNAIKASIIKRQPCEVCGAIENVHKHHDDYSKPLEVRWLCCQHHFEHHKELKEAKCY